MLFQKLDGSPVEVESTPARRAVIDRLIGSLVEAGSTVADVAEVLGCSPAFVSKRLKAIRAAAERIAEDQVVCLDGKPGWVPQDEPQGHRGPCPRCRGVVVPGSPFVCLSCLHSGIDDRLEAELSAERAREAAHRERRRDRRSF
jgi:hypothetical protein